MPMPTYPTPELGASAWVAPVSWISWGIGVYKGGMLDPLAEEGAAIDCRPFTILETRIEPFGDSSSSYGSYSVGFWRQSRGAWLARAEDIAPATNYGVYVNADHWFQRSPSGENRGPGLFSQWGWAPSDRNEIAGYAGGGIAWAGLVPGRQRDSAGIGVTRVRLAENPNETIFELFYKCHLTGKLMVQPDLQWVHRPGGDGRNALVAGLRLGVEF
jgi:carbohydrate-selective porin OprB